MKAEILALVAATSVACSVVLAGKILGRLVLLVARIRLAVRLRMVTRTSQDVNEQKKNTLMNIANPAIRHKLRIARKDQLSPTAWLFRLDLPHPSLVLGVPAGMIIHVHGRNPLIQEALARGVSISTLRWNDKPTHETSPEIVRRYGPVSPETSQGYCEFLIRLYLPTKTFRDGGMMSRLLFASKVGDSLEVSGPHGRVRYVGNGRLLVHQIHEMQSDHIAMILGGSGLTPGYAIALKILEDDHDLTQIHIIYSCRSVREILLFDQFRHLAAKYRGQIHVHLTTTFSKNPLSSSTSFDTQLACSEDDNNNNMSLSKGRVTTEMIQQYLPPPSCRPLICIVGPPGFLLSCVRPALDELNYDLTSIAPF